MTGIFDPAIFDPAIFDVGSATPPSTGGGGSHFPRRRPIRVRLDITDDEEAALVIALLRHRFRL